MGKAISFRKKKHTVLFIQAHNKVHLSRYFDLSANQIDFHNDQKCDRICEKPS